jgi:hypothetical protein
MFPSTIKAERFYMQGVRRVFCNSSLRLKTSEIELKKLDLRGVSVTN